MKLKKIFSGRSTSKPILSIIKDLKELVLTPALIVSGLNWHVGVHSDSDLFAFVINGCFFVATSGSNKSVLA